MREQYVHDKNHLSGKQKKLTNHKYLTVVEQHINMNKTLQFSNTLQILYIFTINIDLKKSNYINIITTTAKANFEFLDFSGAVPTLIINRQKLVSSITDRFSEETIGLKSNISPEGKKYSNSKNFFFFF